MSGIIAVYSLVIAVLIAEDMAPPSTQSYSLFKYDSHPRPLPTSLPFPVLAVRSCPREEWNQGHMDISLLTQ